MSDPIQRRLIKALIALREIRDLPGYRQDEAQEIARRALKTNLRAMGKITGGQFHGQPVAYRK